MATQQIYGAVLPDGGIMSGQGFQCDKIKEGTYLIRFERPFGQLPAPVCMISGSEWRTFDKSVAIVEVMPFHFICVTSDPRMPVDCAFQFIVVGDE